MHTHTFKNIYMTIQSIVTEWIVFLVQSVATCVGGLSDLDHRSGFVWKTRWCDVLKNLFFTQDQLWPPPTFDRGVGWRPLHAQVPRRVTLVGKVPHLQVADGEPDDGCLVQLAGNGARQWQHLGQLIKLKVLFAAPWPRSVPWLLLPQSLQPKGRVKTKCETRCWQFQGTNPKPECTNDVSPGP